MKKKYLMPRNGAEALIPVALAITVGLGAHTIGANTKVASVLAVVGLIGAQYYLYNKHKAQDELMQKEYKDYLQMTKS